MRYCMFFSFYMFFTTWYNVFTYFVMWTLDVFPLTCFFYHYRCYFENIVNRFFSRVLYIIIYIHYDSLCFCQCDPFQNHGLRRLLVLPSRRRELSNSAGGLEGCRGLGDWEVIWSKSLYSDIMTWFTMIYNKLKMERKTCFKTLKKC